MTDVTDQDLLALRRAARVLQSSLRHEDEHGRIAGLLRSIADDYDAPELCEGCDEAGVYADDEGYYACESCAQDVAP